MHNACEQTKKHTSNHTPAPIHSRSRSWFLFFQLSRSFIHSNFRHSCLISLHSRQWLRFIYADSFLMFRFVPHFQSKKANERICLVWLGLYSFLSLFVNFFVDVCQPSEYAAQNKHKFIYTRIHLRANINGNDRRDMHILMHTRNKKPFLIHATHSFAFLSASSSVSWPARTFYALLFFAPVCVQVWIFRNVIHFRNSCEILWNKWISLYAG